ncbi:uncharacterized protein K452DRAFT_305137 [Aplosporella prunicola CBS 121167]|uniref:Uncharacterized protein n=1 Tax=Aplosporella prunicola CBS 121167 TaxID=1176127 RepID=A0A6A6BSA3_9PEZI|nr:uncharacterized protein K452DRAFT_305137 [Aplosporella prunicola CBS 121167]KAF2146165.1 hypothetical protein K452DRAFT_305137 [Aplosporella prunicola CBS 121167]
MINKESLFKWTYDRFLADENTFMAMHRVDFNVGALVRAASRVTNGVPCKSIIKISEDYYLPQVLRAPDAKWKTINRQDAPAARQYPAPDMREPGRCDGLLLDWNSRLGAENPVGSEYILMKKIPGIRLESLWETNRFTKEHLEELAKQIAYMEKRLLNMTFCNIGAIYYKGDISPAKPFVYTNPEGEEVNNPKFVIGPVTSRSWLLNGRCTLECDRGPWDSPIDFLKAIVNRELLATDTAPQLPQPMDSLLGPGSYRPSILKNHRAGSMYLQLLEHVLPTHPAMSQYRLWHNRLSEDCILAPLYKQDIQLPYFHHWVRKADAVYGYEEDPSLSETLDNEPYRGTCKLQNLSNDILRLNRRPDVLHAQMYRNSTAGNILEMGEHIFDEPSAALGERVVRLRKRWKKGLPYVGKKDRDAAFPVRLTHRRIRSIRRVLNEWSHARDIKGGLSARMKGHMPWLAQSAMENMEGLRRCWPIIKISF